MKITGLKASLLSVLSLLFILSCAAIKSQDAQSTEQMLSAAGFVMIPAQTPEEVAHLNSLTPLKVEFSVKDNKPLYWYADPYSCKCVFTGDQAAYENYEKIRVAQNIADEEEDAALMNEQAAADANMWGWLGGPWGW